MSVSVDRVGAAALCVLASGCGLFGGLDPSLARWVGVCPPVTGPLHAVVDPALDPRSVIEAAFAPVNAGLPPRMQSVYDDAKRLLRVELDVNADERPDRFEYFDGEPTPRRIEIDGDFDGVIDRWVELDPDGRVVSSRVDSNRDGTPDATRVPDPEQDLSLTVPPPVSAGGSCAQDPECERYIAELRAEVLDRWTPRDPKKRVRLQIFVSESGCPYDARVLEAPSRRSASEALDALSRSRPLRPLPEALAELRNEKIVMTFARPSTDP